MDNVLAIMEFLCRDGLTVDCAAVICAKFVGDCIESKNHRATANIIAGLAASCGVGLEFAN